MSRVDSLLLLLIPAEVASSHFVDSLLLAARFGSLGSLEGFLVPVTSLFLLVVDVDWIGGAAAGVAVRAFFE